MLEHKVSLFNGIQYDFDIWRNFMVNNENKIDIDQFDAVAVDVDFK